MSPKWRPHSPDVWMGGNFLVSTKPKQLKKEGTETIRSDVYEDGSSAMGVSHLRRRNTTQEVTATSDSGVHKPGKDFLTTHKASMPIPTEMHELETGAGHKSLRTMQNMKT